MVRGLLGPMVTPKVELILLKGLLVVNSVVQQEVVVKMPR
jgi:hypothetical protein